MKGRIDAGETPEQAANRELMEEAGWCARRARAQPDLAPTYMSHQTHVVLARPLSRSACRATGGGPELVPRKLTDLGQLILREEFRRGAASPRGFLVASGCSSMRMDEALREGVIAWRYRAAARILAV